MQTYVSSDLGDTHMSPAFPYCSSTFTKHVEKIIDLMNRKDVGFPYD